MTGWPDPDRPGVPLSPERDGWHWVRGEPALWRVEFQQWWFDSSHEGAEPLSVAARSWSYSGPVLMPDEHRALVAERDATLRVAEKRLARADEAESALLDIARRVTGEPCLPSGEVRPLAALAEHVAQVATTQRESALEACRAFVAWLDAEDSKPDYGALTRDTHPEGERIFREWWERNLRLCKRAQELGRAAVRAAQEGKA